MSAFARLAKRSVPCIVPLLIAVCAVRVADRKANAEQPRPQEVAGLKPPPKVDPAATEFFEKKVRPILAARCYKCHSAKVDEPKGGLRVDSLAAMLEGGDTEAAIVPGKPEKSLLIDSINYRGDYEMPPKTKLPAAEIEILTRWVKMGAPWPAHDKDPVAVKKDRPSLAEQKAAHWAWSSLARPKPPVVKNTGWPLEPIDRFILGRLESKGITPAEPADKRALLRRVSFALTGLPPKREEIDAFLSDKSPKAYEAVVDRLLRSPHFGERWARHWLDLVRYAESRGHEFDYSTPNAFQYRDYVIRALNADVPYNQFVVEHIAGDLLRGPRRHPTEGYNESIIATGFWFMGEWVHSPVDIRLDEADLSDGQDEHGSFLEACFVASSGCYATVALREIMKAD